MMLYLQPVSTIILVLWRFTWTLVELSAFLKDTTGSLSSPELTSSLCLCRFWLVEPADLGLEQHTCKCPTFFQMLYVELIAPHLFMLWPSVLCTCSRCRSLQVLNFNLTFDSWATWWTWIESFLVPLDNRHASCTAVSSLCASFMVLAKSRLSCCKNFCFRVLEDMCRWACLPSVPLIWTYRVLLQHFVLARSIRPERFSHLRIFCVAWECTEDSLYWPRQCNIGALWTLSSFSVRREATA